MSLEHLEKQHGIKSYVANGKIGLNYDQLNATNSDPVSQQCRGLVLREGSYDIIAYPMNRFFNLEQKDVAANIDWSSALYWEKLDGTCIIVAFDDQLNKWCCGTRGRPDADANAHDCGMTFSQLVDATVNEMRSRAHPMMLFDRAANLQDFCRKANKNYTYVFELTSPFNRIVCKYEESTLTLLAVRNNVTLDEVDPRDAVFAFADFLVLLPLKYSFNSIEDMVKVIREWNPEHHEGVVVCDKNFNRVKVKNPSYVAFNHIRNSLSTSWRGCAEVIMLGKDDDVVAMMPQVIVNRISLLKPAIKKVIEQTQADYDEIKDEDDMKSFAFQANIKLWPAALFALKRGKATDLKTYMLGNKSDVSKLPQNAVDNMLRLAAKIDPDINRAMKGEFK